MAAIVFLFLNGFEAYADERIWKDTFTRQMKSSAPSTDASKPVAERDSVGTAVDRYTAAGVWTDETPGHFVSHTAAL